MRNNDPIFWPATDVETNIRQQINKNYSDSINILQTQWYQADLDQRFVMGDQDLWGLIFPGVATYRKKTFNFNITNGLIQTPSGYQRRNRKTSTVIPIHSQIQKTADQLTKCLFHVINKNGVYQKYSDSFEKGALTKGLGFLQTYINRNEDVVSGDICKRYVDMAACIFDPYFRRHDMSDCRFWQTRQFLDRNEAADLNPEFRDQILSLPSGTYRDDKFYYMPEVYQIQFPNLIAWDEYWYLANREATYIIDKESEECQEWIGDEEQLRDMMRMKDKTDGIEMRKKLAVKKQMKPTVRRTILLNDKVMVDEPNPLKIDRYPVCCCLGYFNPDSPYYAYKFRGIARDCRDAQYCFNRFQVNGMDQVEAQQAGIKMEKGALLTPDDALNQGNGRVLVTKVGSFDKVDKLHIDPPSPVFLQMVDTLKNYMMEIAGVTPEMMGQEIDDKAGIITMIRQAASITRLQTLFDQFDEFQRLDGDLTIEVMQKNWTYGKVRAVIGEEPTEEFDNKLFFKYGCKVATGVLTETQQQLEAQQLLYARELGIPISSKRILQKLVIQDKDEIIAEIEQEEKQKAQQEQQMAQLQMQQMQVDNETKLSYARSQDGLAQERIAKIQLDKALNAERMERVEEEKTQGLLNVIKALKEIQSLNLGHIEQDLLNLEHAKRILQEPQGSTETNKPPEKRAI
jgi:hypothetical protein